MKIMKAEYEKKLSLYEMADIMERMISMNSTNVPVDYGTGCKYNPVEVHTISYIADYPGITITQIAVEWNRTKGAVSQTVKKLEGMGLLYREKKTGNDKKICLYLTEKGKELDEMHRQYDIRNYAGFLEKMYPYCSAEEIQSAFRVMEIWIEQSKDWEPS